MRVPSATAADGAHPRPARRSCAARTAQGQRADRARNRFMCHAGRGVFGPSRPVPGPARFVESQCRGGARRREVEAGPRRAAWAGTTKSTGGSDGRGQSALPRAKSACAKTARAGAPRHDAGKKKRCERGLAHPVRTHRRAGAPAGFRPLALSITVGSRLSSATCSNVFWFATAASRAFPSGSARRRGYRD